MAGPMVMTAGEGTPEKAAYTQQFTMGYAYFVLFMLMLTYTGHSIDRSIISTIMAPIQKDFALSDSQLGLIAGTIYALSNAVFTIPIGYFADRTNRKNLLSVCAAIWSGMTMLGGLSGNFVHLMLTRAGIGASEAAGTPVSTSLIADYFPPERRASAISIFYISASLGGFLALAVGGYVVQNHGWRTAMLLAGLPGFIVAIIFFFVVREPIRTGVSGAVAANAPSLGKVIKFILTQPALVVLMFAGALTNFVGSGVASWVPTYYVRVLEIPIAQVGSLLGFGQLIFGVIGGVGAGFLADKLVRKDRRWPIWLLAIAQFMTVPFYIGSVLVDNIFVSVLLLAIGFGFTSTFTGPLYSQVQTLVGSRMRALAVAVLVMMISLLGYGLGAQATGLISDAMKPAFGGVALRYALIAVACGGLVTATLYYISSLGLIKGQNRVLEMERAHQ